MRVQPKVGYPVYQDDKQKGGLRPAVTIIQYGKNGPPSTTHHPADNLPVDEEYPNGITKGR